MSISITPTGPVALPRPATVAAILRAIGATRVAAACLRPIAHHLPITISLAAAPAIATITGAAVAVEILPIIANLAAIPAMVAAPFPITPLAIVPAVRATVAIINIIAGAGIIIVAIPAITTAIAVTAAIIGGVIIVVAIAAISARAIAQRYAVITIAVSAAAKADGRSQREGRKAYSG
jgi:hypothetical protein